MKRATLLCILAAAPIAVFSQGFTTSFEAVQGYSLGDANGQQGWVLTSGTGAAFQITNNRAHTGTQSVTSSATSVSQSLFDLSHSFTLAPASPVFLTSFLWVDGSSIQANRAFGISLANDITASSTVAGITVDGAGSVRFAQDYAGMFSATPIATGRLADLVNRWLTVSISVNPTVATNNAVWTISGLGTTTGSASITSTGTIDVPNPDIDNIVLFNEWTNDFSNSNGTAFWDDVTAAPVPEPASMAVLGVGALALLRRRRK